MSDIVVKYNIRQDLLFHLLPNSKILMYRLSEYHWKPERDGLSKSGCFGLGTDPDLVPWPCINRQWLSGCINVHIYTLCIRPWGLTAGLPGFAQSPNYMQFCRDKFDTVRLTPVSVQPGAPFI